jgi:OHCU decarboxylase
MTLAELNSMPLYRAEEELLKCCGSKIWARTMARRRPFASQDRVARAAEEVWRALQTSDWLEAFAAHPRIGESKPGPSRDWSTQEQSGTHGATATVAGALAEANQEYCARFGFIFIVCATGKSAEEMLAVLRSRLSNAPDREIQIAAEEQNKITMLRLAKLIAS